MIKYIILFIMITASLLLVACTTTEVVESNHDPTKVDPAKVINTPEDLMPKQVLIPMDEVTKHNSENDCWLLIHGKVYDVSEFTVKHPGGKAILQGCGTDATTLYETRPMGSGTPHSSNARDLLEQYYLGDLKG